MCRVLYTSYRYMIYIAASKHTYLASRTHTQPDPRASRGPTRHTPLLSKHHGAH